MKKGRVEIASKYHVNTLINNVLVQQFNFPFTYEADLDVLIGEDNDTLLKIKPKRTARCFLQHTEYDEKFLRKWLKDCSNEKVIDFIKDLIEADSEIEWTGYRILATINPSKGNTYWRFELFSKHPNSSTAVYTGELAPNVLQNKNEEKIILTK